MSTLIDTAEIAPAEQPSVTRRVFRNSFAVTSAEWIMKATNLAFTVYVVRRLGEVGYGNFASAVAFVGLSSVLFELGLAQSAQRDIARDRSRINDLFWNIVSLRLLLAVPGVVLVPVLAWLVGYEHEIVVAVAVQAGTFVPSAFLIPLLIILTAHERFDIAARLAVIMNFLYVGLAVLLLMQIPGYLVLIGVAYVTMPVHVGLTLRAVRATGVTLPRFSITPRVWKGLVRASLPFGISSLALTFNFHADAVMLGLFGSVAAVGSYSAAYRIILSLSVAVAGFTRSITPTLSRLHVDDRDEALRWVRGGILGLTSVALPAAVGLSLLARPVVALLYGPDFTPSGAALAVLAWDFPFLAVAAFGGNVMTAMDRERVAARVYIAAAVFNVVMNAAFIPRFGLVAASAVTVATDALVLLALYGPVWKAIAQGGMVHQLRAVALASAVMGIVVWFVRASPLIVSIPIGVITYLLACTVLGLPQLVVRRWATLRQT
jgi:O-antigen/teichoic acid export membrane protein